MKSAEETFKTPLRNVFSQFACLDLAIEPEGEKSAVDWSLASCVTLDAADGGRVSVFATDYLAAAMAESFLGVPECSEAEKHDIVRELANVLAGICYDIARDGRRPSSIGVPSLQTDENARELWRSFPPESRYVVFDECGVQGGVSIHFPGSFSKGWE